MGTTGSIPCFFSFLAGAMAPYIYKENGQGSFGLQITFIVGALACLLGQIMAVILVYLD